MSMEPKTLADGAIATGLVTSPAWAPWLGDLNQMLTTATLVIGLALGVGRLILFLRERK
jgi:hypothetical protein